MSKNVSAKLMKQLKATAAVRSYDFIFQSDKMKQEEQMKQMYDYYHGDEDANIVSQCKMLLSGHGPYSGVYDKELVMIMNDTTAAPDEPTQLLIVKKEFFALGDYERIVASESFTYDTLSSPTKEYVGKRATGRFLLDLSVSAIKNIKKAVAMAEEWLSNNKVPPSGTNWNDLYAHLLSRCEEIHKTEKIFTGFMAFVLFSKYNANGVNNLAFLSMNDEIDGDIMPRSDFCKRDQRIKVRTRVMLGKNSNDRESTIDDRIKLVKIAQCEVRKVTNDSKLQITNMQQKLEFLLKERGQAVELAKIICPDYNKQHENWIEVQNLTHDISTMKREIDNLEQDWDEKRATKSSHKALVESFLNDINVKKQRVR
eukprot:CAMPEP_0113319380 /NCGR_PEP_ID=MMETSP0010_2-20120614/13594_1 /TAXON_ID=216773 ORGANISM="Corethron hystrix, Strain 308" /NCGR_SAMPLE_ID=MMETSP0010_2 /ASSEMBLY_ACC=CAM_ASM_000155 /LENGTH=368 /DNA_ID=CAMNT_0000176915 /DNA_START=712 /DNA_END=1818 /DNA_ORIENTATION=- /assembly_acc=CAM_ASM_000155